jgi:hypothetical protein
MKNPVRDEASAFQVVWLTLGGAVLVVVAAWIETWLGVIVFLLLVAAALWTIRGGMRHRSQAHVVRDEGPTRRILVVANETVGGEELMSAISELALGGKSEFFVVSPALNSRLKTWTSDEDPARAAAQKRLDATLSRLGSVGIEARGEVGDVDPLVAIEDAVRMFRPDEIVLSTHPEGRSNWLERGVVSAVRERYDVPVTHVVVDLEAHEAR